MSALVARASPAPYRPTAAAARDAEKSGEETPAGVGGGGSSKESGGSGSQPSGSLHPRDSVKEAAARLQGQGAGDGADTVVLKQVLGRGGSGTVYLGESWWLRRRARCCASCSLTLERVWRLDCSAARRHVAWAAGGGQDHGV